MGIKRVDRGAELYNDTCIPCPPLFRAKDGCQGNCADQLELVKNFKRNLKLKL